MNAFPTPRETAALADQAEAQAWADFIAAAPETLKTELCLGVEEVGDATLLIGPGTSLTYFNRVIGLGMRGEATADQVDRIVERYRRAGSSEWLLLWSDLARPATMPSMLTARGFTYPASSSWVKLYRDARAPAPVASELVIAEASADQAVELARVVVGVFGMPSFVCEWLVRVRGRTGWKLYAVLDGERIVGGGCLFVSGEQAWLGWGAIAESHRCRGGQSALIARRVEDAIASGARHLFAETGEPAEGSSNASLDNMLRNGFSRIVSRQNVMGPAF
ncbi:GNAT family N-acetyltransferase [Burkholderia plantarii]|uniref:GNAT family N-acetyltransferase n=1 Tax=Burkholderia plantarii TaxID=41899 RepID=UPI00087089AB|nr:GNAT family N-acetyltransferase [Burkholderia plantarii]WLE62236.1 GNAT family N-acetyltransferase [Burkholderia plantarii]